MKKTVLPILFVSFGLLLTSCNNEKISSTTSSSNSSEPVSSQTVSSNEEKFTITVNKNEGGDVQLSSTSSKKGETITVTINVNDGFEFDSITSNDVTLTEVSKASSYTFTMPEKAVTITVSFKKLVKKVQISEVKSFLFDYSPTFSLKAEDQVEIGSSQKLTVSFPSDNHPSADTSLQAIINNVSYDLVSSKANDGTNFEVNFVTPETDFSIFVAEKSTTDEEGKIISFTQGDTYTVLGLVSGQKYKADSEFGYSVDFFIYPKTGYKVSEVNLVDASNNKVQVSPATYSGDPYQYTIRSISSDSSLQITTATANKHTITYVGLTEENHVDINKSITPLEAYDSSFVSVNLLASDGFYISNVSDSASIINTRDPSSFTFMMPDADLTITITTDAFINIDYVKNDKLTSVKFFSDYALKNEITQANENQQVYISVTSKEGYKVTGIKDINNPDNSSWYDEYNKSWITYIQKNSKFEFVVSSKHTVSGDIVLERADGIYYQGEKVIFILILDANKEVVENSVKASYIENNQTKQLEVTYQSWDKKYVFTMPDADVTISFETTTLEYKSLSLGDFSSDKNIKNVEIIGSKSNNKLTSSNTTNKFIVGENISINLRLNSNQFKYKVVLTKDKVTQDLDLTLIGSNYKTSFTYDSQTKIEIVKVSENKVYTPIINDTTGINLKISYKVNNTDVTSLDKIYANDEVSLIINTAIPEGKELDVSAKDANNNDVSINKYESKYTFTVPESVVTITFSLKNAPIQFTVTVIDNTSTKELTSDLDEGYVTLFSLGNDWDEYYYPSTILEGTKVFLGEPFSTYKYTLTVNGTNPELIEDDYGESYFICSGNIVATFSDAN